MQEKKELMLMFQKDPQVAGMIINTFASILQCHLAFKTKMVNKRERERDMHYVESDVLIRQFLGIGSGR